MTAQQAHPAELACEFMTRATLKGLEVEAYAQTYNWLQSILTGDNVVVDKKTYEQLTADDGGGESPPDEDLEGVE